MLIGFIGMSGAGKSYWADKLSKQGFERWHCDEMLLEEFNKRLNLNFKNLNDSSEWLGFPYQETYTERETIFLECEKKLLEKILLRLEKTDIKNRNIVIDMGGSTIYAGEELFKRLRNIMLIVYLEVSENVIEKMLRNYKLYPKTLIWKGMYKPLPNEEKEDTLSRCYPELIESRSNIYTKFADISIPYSVHRNPNLSTNSFLQLLSKQEV